MGYIEDLRSLWENASDFKGAKVLIFNPQVQISL